MKKFTNTYGDIVSFLCRRVDAWKNSGYDGKEHPEHMEMVDIVLSGLYPITVPQLEGILNGEYRICNMFPGEEFFLDLERKVKSNLDIILKDMEEKAAAAYNRGLSEGMIDAKPSLSSPSPQGFSPAQQLNAAQKAWQDMQSPEAKSHAAGVKWNPIQQDDLPSGLAQKGQGEVNRPQEGTHWPAESRIVGVNQGDVQSNDKIAADQLAAVSNQRNPGVLVQALKSASWSQSVIDELAPKIAAIAPEYGIRWNKYQSAVLIGYLAYSPNDWTDILFTGDQIRNNLHRSTVHFLSALTIALKVLQ